MAPYKTLKDEAYGEITIKKSRFICYGKHVELKSDAETYIKQIKSAHWDAKHNVYAYCLKENNIEKSSDDGEPAGTAGIPILKVIKSMKLYDLVIVITRYFGGILLGTGGLSRAYLQGAQKAIESCGIVEMQNFNRVKAKIKYEILGKFKNTIINFGAVVDRCIYGDIVEISFYVKPEELNNIIGLTNEISYGESNIKVEGEKFLPINTIE